jgi:hypothetical protein
MKRFARSLLHLAARWVPAPVPLQRPAVQQAVTVKQHLQRYHGAPSCAGGTRLACLQAPSRRGHGTDCSFIRPVSTFTMRYLHE